MPITVRPVPIAVIGLRVDAAISFQEDLPTASKWIFQVDTARP